MVTLVETVLDLKTIQSIAMADLYHVVPMISTAEQLLALHL